MSYGRLPKYAQKLLNGSPTTVSYTHLRAHET